MATTLMTAKTMPQKLSKRNAVAATVLMLSCAGCSSMNSATQNSQQTGSQTNQHNSSSMSFSKKYLSGTGFINTITRKDFNAQYNIAYGQDPRQKLDVYQPLNDVSEKSSSKGNASKINDKPSMLKPVILFVHGGSWATGSKDDYLFVGQSFAQAGYVTVVINYRLAPKHKYPNFVQDTALAARWISQNINRYGGDPTQIVVMGHSAGAFNAVEVVDNSRWLTEAGVPISSIKAVVGIAGPYSYDFRTDSTRNAFEVGVTPDQVMPDRHVRADAPPHLLLVGTKDKRVAPINSQNMQKALLAQHIPVQLGVVDGANHISIMAAVATRLSWYKNTREQILDYLAKTLKP